MAYQPTRGRKAFVSPTGMPDLSGYRQLAKSFTDVGEAAYTIGSDIRQREFNDAIIQAELDGKTAGATYDKDGNLVPLTNLDYGKSAEIFGTASQKAVEQAYRKSALQTYAQSIGVAANAAANTAFQNNPTDPEAVRGSMLGFLDGLSVPDEVKQQVTPRIVAEFTAAESQSRAGQAKMVRENAINTALADLNINTKRLGTLTANANSPELYEGNNRMAQELVTAIDGNLEILRENGYTDSDVQKIRNGIETSVALQVNQAHIERVFLSKGEAEARAEIIRVRKAFEDDESVNGESVASAMEGFLSDLVSAKNAADKEAAKTKTALYNSTALGIVLGTIQMDELQISQMPGLDDNQKYGLVSILRGQIAIGRNASKEQAKNEQDLSNKIYDDALGRYQFEDGQYTIENEHSRTITQLYVDGKIEPKKYWAFKKVQSNRLLGAMKERGDIAVGTLISNMSTFSIPYDVIKQAGNELIEAGVIGTLPQSRMTREQWEAKLSKYKSDYKKNQGNLLEISRLETKAKSIHLSPSEVDKIVEFSPTVAQVDGQNVPIDIFSEDQRIRDASLEVAVLFTEKYGALHPSIRDQLKNFGFMRNEDDFNSAVQFFSKYMNTVESKNVTGGYYQGVATLERAGVNVGILESARLYGYDFTKKLTEYRSSSNRNLSQFYASDQNENDYFAEMFRKHAKSQSMLDYILNLGGDKSGKYEAMYNTLLNQSGVGSIDEAILSDPRLFSLLKSGVDYTLASGEVSPNEEGYIVAIHKSIANLMGDIGLQEDADGNVSWVLHPIMVEAQSTVGDRGVGIDMDSIRMDVQRTVSAFPGLQTAEIDKLIKAGDFVYEANVVPGKDPTYRVYVRDEFGERTLILPNYRYDFKYSIQNEVYNDTLESIENSTIKQILTALPGMDAVVLRNHFKSMEAYEDSEQFLAPLIKLYNDIGIQTIDDFEPIEIGKDEFGLLMDKILSLGIG